MTTKPIEIYTVVRYLLFCFLKFYGFISTFNPSKFTKCDTLVMGVSVVIGIFVCHFRRILPMGMDLQSFYRHGGYVLVFVVSVGTTFRTNVRNTVREERSELSETLSDQ